MRNHSPCGRVGPPPATRAVTLDRRTSQPLLLVVLGLLWSALGGCSANREQIEQAQALHGSGNFSAAYQLLSGPEAADAHLETQDALLWMMEEGKCGIDAGQFRPSYPVLTQASKLADRFQDEWAKTSVGEELGSIVINSRVRPYRGTYADRIEIEVNRMVAAILAGDQLQAGVAARRAIERQKDTQIEEAKRIEAVNKEIANRGGTDSVKAILASQGIDLTAAYAPYLNPVASWLSGLLQSSTGDGNDRQRGETDLRRALAMVPTSVVLAAQTSTNPYDQARNGQPQVIVLFELGSAPRIDQITIPLVTPWLGLSTIPIPVMNFEPRPAEALDVTGGGVTVRTETLAVIEQIWKRDFDQRMPEIILRTAVMVAAKEAATYAASEPFRRQANQGKTSGQVGQVLVLLGASLYKAATNQADLRTWRSIPAEVQIAQLPRPANGEVTLQLVRGGVPATPAIVKLPEAPVVLVWARCVVPNQVVACAAPLQANYSLVPGPPPEFEIEAKPVPQPSPAAPAPPQPAPSPTPPEPS